MKVCFPVKKDEGLESTVNEHLGSAPVFVVLDTDTETAGAIVNNDVNLNNVTFNPAKALSGNPVDIVIVNDIEAETLFNFNSMGIRVFQSQKPTVKENCDVLMTGEMLEFVLEGSCCGGHGHGGHEHGHEHGHGNSGCGCAH